MQASLQNAFAEGATIIYFIKSQPRVYIFSESGRTTQEVGTKPWSCLEKRHGWVRTTTRAELQAELDAFSTGGCWAPKEHLTDWTYSDPSFWRASAQNAQRRLSLKGKVVMLVANDKIQAFEREFWAMCTYPYEFTENCAMSLRMMIFLCRVMKCVGIWKIRVTGMSQITRRGATKSCMGKRYSHVPMWPTDLNVIESKRLLIWFQVLHVKKWRLTGVWCSIKEERAELPEKAAVKIHLPVPASWLYEARCVSYTSTKPTKQRMEADADTKIQLPSIKSDVKEIHKNVKKVGKRPV